MIAGRLGRVRYYPMRLQAGAFLFLSLILVTAFLLFRPGLGGPYLLDDDTYLSRSEVASLSAETLQREALSGSHFYRVSRALPRLSFSVTQYVSGDDARYWLKYQNLLLHLLNGLLVFWLVMLLAGRRSPTDLSPSGATSGTALWFALAVTALWLLHPLQVSTVLYVTQRFVLMAALFMLAALICYVKGRSLAMHRPVAGISLALAGVAFFGLAGLLSKEIAALLPLLILAIEWFFFGSFASRRERRAVGVLLLLVVIAPLLVLAWILLPRLEGMLGFHAGRGFSGIERLMTQAHVIGLYLKLFFVPLPGTMSLFHDGFPVTRALDAATLGLGVLYAAAIGIGLALRRRAPWIGFGILWFFIAHLLESTILSLELVFEHRNYLAILGLTVAAASAVALLLARARLRRLALPLAGALVVLLGFNTAVRATDWGSLERLLTVEYRRDPSSPRVLMELMSYTSAQGNQQAAVAYLQRLLALDVPEAGPELTAMQIYCPQQQMPEGLYQQALSKLKQGRLSPTAVNGLGRLVDRALRGQCPAMAADQLLTLTETARTNRQARSPNQNCTAGEMQVRVLIEQDDWAGAEQVLGATLDRCRRGSPETIQFIVDNLLRFGAYQGGLDQVEGMLQSMAADASRRKVLDRAYAGIGGFDMERVLGGGKRESTP